MANSKNESRITYPLSHRELPALGLALALMTGMGCRPRDAITTYEVPPVASIAPAESPASPSRTLATAVPQSDRVWFFKMTGLAEKVSEQVEAYQQLVESIRFQQGEPTWTLPVGWQQVNGTGMRFATLTAPNELEVTVIALPAGAYNELDNVNRWRQQLGLTPLTTAELEANVVRKSLSDVASVSIDISGEAAPANAMGGPFSGAPRGSLPAPLQGSETASNGQPASLSPESAAPPDTTSAPAAPPAAGVEKPTSEPTADHVPTHWQAGRLSAMRKAAYDIADGELRGEVTVIVLSAQSGSVADNVNRWRGQLNLPPQEAEQIESALTKLSNGANYLEITEADNTSAQGMFAAFIRTDTETWYFKFMGPTALLAKERDNFRTFVERYPLPQ